MGSQRQPVSLRERRWRFLWGRSRATVRIAWDLVRTLVAPPQGPGPMAPAWEAARKVAQNPMGAERPGGSLRLVTWNIHRAYDARGVGGGLTSMLRELEPDLVLLQEVPVTGAGSPWHGLELSAYFEGFHLAWAPMHRVLQPTTYYPFHACGQLTASRVAIDKAEVLPLPQVSRHKLGRHHRVRRVALITRHAGRDPLTVVNLHLENTARPSGRAAQMRTALAAVTAVNRVVLAGDLNTAVGRFETAGSEAEALGFSEIHISGRRLSLDRVFVRGLGPGSGRLLRVAGSDHLPVVVDLQSR